jgi:3-oxoacyl-(acyl-carrier-protein) synthase
MEELASLREFISPLESRRMGKLMKAAHLSALRAMQDAQISCPDAIITATSRGMFEISMQFLDDILVNGEELLKPTLFMQSTHNTISSAIAIRCQCHGYNTTYSHGDGSMHWAIRDAERLIETGKAETVLVIEFDESTQALTEMSKQCNVRVPKDLYARSVVLKRS